MGAAHQHYQPGDAVFTGYTYGNGLQKRREGTVVKLGSAGALVRFERDGEKWVPLGKLHPAIPEAPPAATLMPPTLALAPVAPPAPPTPAPPTPAPPTPAAAPGEVALQALESEGADPVAVWVAMGRALLSRAQDQLEAAELEEEEAEAEAKEAEQLLTDARRRLAGAKARVASAEGALATLRAKVSLG